MILKNLKLLISNSRFLFILLLVTQLVAVNVIMLSYGIFLNNRYSLSYDDTMKKKINISFETDDNGNTLAKMSDIKEAFPKIMEKYESVITQIGFVCKAQIEPAIPHEMISENALISSEMDEAASVSQVELHTVFSLKDGHYEFPPNTIKDRGYVAGEFYTEKDMDDGACKCFLSDTLYRLNPSDCTLGGVNYEVVAHEQTGFEQSVFGLEAHMPLEAMPDNAQPDYMSIHFSEVITRDEYNELTDSLNKAIGDGTMDFMEYVVVDLDKTTTVRTMMLLSIGMAVLATFTICIIYRFILEKRIQMITIYRLCGASRGRAAGIFAAEMLIVLGLTSCAGCLIYGLLIEPGLENIFPWFKRIYYAGVYLKMTAIYFGIVYISVIMEIIHISRKNLYAILSRR